MTATVDIDTHNDANAFLTNAHRALGEGGERLTELEKLQVLGAVHAVSWMLGQGIHPAFYIVREQNRDLLGVHVGTRYQDWLTNRNNRLPVIHAPAPDRPTTAEPDALAPPVEEEIEPLASYMIRAVGHYIEAAVAASGGIKPAARALGCEPKAIRYHLNRWQLRKGDERPVRYYFSDSLAAEMERTTLSQRILIIRSHYIAHVAKACGGHMGNTRERLAIGREQLRSHVHAWQSYASLHHVGDTLFKGFGDR